MNRARNDFITQLKNIMRGQVSHRPSRHKILQVLLRSNFAIEEELNEFLLSSTYKIDPQQWTNLSLESSDWIDLAQIDATKNVTLFSNVSKLFERHILENQRSIKTLAQLSDDLSCLILDQSETSPVGLLDAISPMDQQSLFFWRAISAAYTRQGRQLTKHLSAQTKSKWAARRFLYALVFFSINQPPSRNIPSALKYVLTGTETTWEVRFLEYACGYQTALPDHSLGFLWISLLMHPFDALELLCDLLDECAAQKKSVHGSLLDVAMRLDATLGYRRLNASLKTYTGQRLKYSAALDENGISLPLTQSTKKFLVQCVAPTAPNATPHKSEFLEAILSLRLTNYPSQAAYDSVVFAARTWRFTEAGRFLQSYASLLFMFPRGSWEHESREFYNLVSFFGSVSNLMLLAPGLATTPTRNEILDIPWAQASASLEEMLPAIHVAKDRTWINVLQYEVSADQVRGHVSNWIARVERHSPIKRNYLCGADWSWLSLVLKERKVHPFRGDARAAFVFLLKCIEEGDPDFGVVRSILRPLYQNRTLVDFLNDLVHHYAARTTSFAYYYFTPENLLLMELVPNEIAAMAGRLYALEHCIRLFGFCEIVTEEIYLDEVKALEAAISYRSISPSQFEIPWQSFINDQAVRTKDIYEATVQLIERTEGGAFPLGEAVSENPVTFPNGLTQSYTLPNFKWAVADFVMEIIHAFFQDPGYGLEAILGTRIRHNVLEREILNALEALSADEIPGIFRRTSDAIFRDLISAVRSAITNWIDKYMHSARTQKPNGLFRLVPTQAELHQLILVVEQELSHRDAIRAVVNWLHTRLREDIVAARHLVAGELRISLLASIESTSETLKLVPGTRAADVERVAKAAVTTVEHKIRQVELWFTWPEEDTSEIVSLGEVCRATIGRFETEIRQGRLAFRTSPDLDQIQFPRTSSRLILDIVSEILVNAMRHCGAAKAHVRTSVRSSPAGDYVVFSNLQKNRIKQGAQRVSGVRHVTQIEYLLAKSGSGLKRIAGCYATALGKETDVCSVSREGHFHLALPIVGKPEARSDD